MRPQLLRRRRHISAGCAGYGMMRHSRRRSGRRVRHGHARQTRSQVCRSWWRRRAGITGVELRSECRPRSVPGVRLADRGAERIDPHPARLTRRHLIVWRMVETGIRSRGWHRRTDRVAPEQVSVRRHCGAFRRHGSFAAKGGMFDDLGGPWRHCARTAAPGRGVRSGRSGRGHGGRRRSGLGSSCCIGLTCASAVRVIWYSQEGQPAVPALSSLGSGRKTDSHPDTARGVHACAPGPRAHTSGAPRAVPPSTAGPQSWLQRRTRSAKSGGWMANEPVAGATGGDSGSAASRTYRSLTAPPVHTPAETEAHATERPGNRSRHSAAVADARPSAGESAQPRRRALSARSRSIRRPLRPIGLHNSAVGTKRAPNARPASLKG